MSVTAPRDALTIDGWAVTDMRLRVSGVLTLHRDDPVHEQLMRDLLLGKERELVARTYVSQRAFALRETSDGDTVVTCTTTASVDSVELE